MAGRTVSVTLEAKVAGYQRDMSAAAGATRGVASEMRMLPAVAARNSQAFTAAGLAMGAAGAAIGIGLKKAADATAQFESKLTKSVTLIGISSGEMKEMGDSALRLSDTGQGPQALADALFFVQSAGMRGAAAMSVVEASAKASSIGLGETATIADLVTSAVNAYGSESLSASDATDVLIGSVREGKAEASELAGAMGRVLPIASNMGITFDQVGAATAAMTRTGTNAAEATTQLRAIMTSLLKPAAQSVETMAEFGLTAEGLRETIAEKGLFEGLMEIRRAVGENDEALAAIFPNVRAYAGVLDLTGASAAENEEIFSRMTDTTGLLSEGFEEWSKTTEAAQMRFAASMEAAKISLGEGLQRPMRAVLDTGTGMAQMFLDIPGPMREVVSIGGAVGAVALTIAGGFLLAAPRITATKAALTDLSATMPRTVGLLRGVGMTLAGPLGIALAGATVLTMSYAKAKGEARARTEEFKSSLDAETGALTDTSRATAAKELQDRDAIEAAKGLGIATQDLVDAVLGDEAAKQRVRRANLSALDAAKLLNQNTAEGSEQYQRILNNVRLVSGAVDEYGGELATARKEIREDLIVLAEQEGKYLDVAHAMEDGNSALEAGFIIQGQAREEAAATGDAVDDLGGEFDETADSTTAADEALQDYMDRLKAITDPVFALETALDGVETAQRDSELAARDLRIAQEELSELQKDGEASASDLAAAEDKVHDAQRRVERSGWDVASALADVEQAALDGDLSFEDFEKKLKDWVRRGEITADQADTMRERVKELRGEAENYQGRYDAEVAVIKFREATAILDGVERRAIAAGEDREIKVSVHGYDNAITNLGKVKASIDQIKSKTITLTAGMVMSSPGPTFASGGPVSGPGSGTSDDIPAWLSNGEYVMKAASVAKYGTHMMDMINAGRFADGGPVGVRQLKIETETSDLDATEFDALGASLADGFMAKAKAFFQKFAGSGSVLPKGSYRKGMPYLGYPGHYGADYPAPTGTPVSSVAAGIVSRAVRLARSYGIHAFINHAGGRQSRYAHLSSLAVSTGQTVGKGQLIGRVGSTGNSTGPHLHYEDRINGAPRNPASLGIFDRGGRLMPGQFGYNGTTDPETVLSPRESAAFDQLVAQMSSPIVNVPAPAPMRLDSRDVDRIVQAVASGGGHSTWNISGTPEEIISKVAARQAFDRNARQGVSV